MKRIKLVLGVVAVMVAIMATVAAPAMADRDDDRRDDRHGFVFNDHKFDHDFDHGFVSFDNDLDRWPWWWNNLENDEVCWWEWSWVFERWDLECD